MKAIEQPYKLTKKQQLLLELVAKSNLVNIFYLTGGTALSAFYLKHRFSEDLDFFSEQEFDQLEITTFFKKNQKQLGYSSIDIQTSFNRFLVFLRFANDNVLKTEFTYYPFPRIEKGYYFHKLQIDSQLDIATNKLFTIAQKPRSRDFVDLFFILNKTELTIRDLYYHAKNKFDWHIDPLHLAGQFNKIDDSDLSMLYKPIKLDTVQKYFQSLIANFQSEILQK